MRVFVMMELPLNVSDFIPLSPSRAARERRGEVLVVVEGRVSENGRKKNILFFFFDSIISSRTHLLQYHGR